MHISSQYQSIGIVSFKQYRIDGPPASFQEGPHQAKQNDKKKTKQLKIILLLAIVYLSDVLM